MNKPGQRFSTAGDNCPERRVHQTAKVELRADGDDKKPRIIGYAALFNKRSINFGSAEFPVFEVLEPGAFDHVLGHDVRAVIDHNGGILTLGRTKSGTLRLEQDELGLRFELDPPETNAARDLVELIRRGDIDQASFAFQVSPDGDQYETEKDGKTTLRTIKKGGISLLQDISPVTFPAYQDTTVTLTRSRTLENLLALRQAPREAWRQQARERALALAEI